MTKASTFLALLLAGSACVLSAQSAKQPKVAPGPGEPDWEVILREQYGLSMFGDLKNPVKATAEATPGLFRKAGPGAVKFTPVIALGLASRTRGGWYAEPRPAAAAPRKMPLWTYIHKNTGDDLRTGKNLPPPLEAGSATEFDPRDVSFGLWISNDEFTDGGVFSQPRLVAKLNHRLARQPYKAMIYPNRDKATGKAVPHSYLIGWEYSTNDDFQERRLPNRQCSTWSTTDSQRLQELRASASSHLHPWSWPRRSWPYVSRAVVARVCRVFRGSTPRSVGHPVRAPG